MHIFQHHFHPVSLPFSRTSKIPPSHTLLSSFNYNAFALLLLLCYNIFKVHIQEQLKAYSSAPFQNYWFHWSGSLIIGTIPKLAQMTPGCS